MTDRGSRRGPTLRKAAGAGGAGENQNSLIAEARAVTADCDRRVQAAVGLVLDIGAQEGSGEHTASAAIDAEHRRAVASELAGLIREDAGQRLEAIAARSDDPEVWRAVAECADEVARSTQGLARGFEGAGHSGSS